MTIPTRRHGTIVRLASQGFGFIQAADGDRGDYFFHGSAVERGAFGDLWIGQAVSFDEGDRSRGSRAEHVSLEGA